MVAIIITMLRAIIIRSLLPFLFVAHSSSSAVHLEFYGWLCLKLWRVKRRERTGEPAEGVNEWLPM